MKPPPPENRNFPSTFAAGPLFCELTAPLGTFLLVGDGWSTKKNHTPHSSSASSSAAVPQCRGPPWTAGRSPWAGCSLGSAPPALSVHARIGRGRPANSSGSPPAKVSAVRRRSGPRHRPHRIRAPELSETSPSLASHHHEWLPHVPTVPAWLVGEPPQCPGGANFPFPLPAELLSF